jgi:hypothetical protein
MRAQRKGLRIYEVPVTWTDDPDSKVEIIRTALADLRGVARLQSGSPSGHRSRGNKAGSSAHCHPAPIELTGPEQPR